MKIQDDGGSAFPFNSWVVDDTSGQGRHEGLEMNPILHSPGMTMGDWFAGMALNGICASQATVEANATFETVACYAYRQAEAMLSYRQRHP